MRVIFRMLAVVLCACLLLCLFGCRKPDADAGWMSRTDTYGSMSDTGYYYTDKSKFLYYVDFQSNVNVSLCQKVGCTHDDADTCEAYLGTERVLLWSDHLYYLANDTYGTHLYRRDATGQNLTTIGTLCEDIMREEQDISINIADTLIASGYLYYYAMVNKMERTENGVNSVSYKDVIRRIDLASGKETSVVESGDSRLELIGIRGQELLYSSILLPEGVTEENASELLANTTTKLILRNVDTGEERLLFEKHRSQYQGLSAFIDGKIYYLYYNGSEKYNAVYDVDSGAQTELPSGFLSVINSRYILLRDKDFHYTLLDMQKNQEIPVAVENAYLSIYCASNQGVIFKYSDRKAMDGQKRLSRYAYVASDALADGLQKSDLIVFYQTSMG